MEYYELKEDEVVLYDGHVNLVGANGSTKLVLTNINVVFINTKQRIFRKDIVEVEIHPINEIKVYEGKPYIRTKDKKVFIYWKDHEKEFEFNSKKEMNEFVSAILKEKNEKGKFKQFVEKTKEMANKVKVKVGEPTIKVAKIVATDVANKAIIKVTNKKIKIPFVGKKKS